MSSTKVLFSEIQFRPDPADHKTGVIDLGLLLEFATPEYWAIGLAIRAGLDDSELSGLDDLTRKLLEHRADVISRELEQVLPKAKKLGQALRLMAAENPWSIHVTSPSEINIPTSAASLRMSTVEKVVEKFVLSIYFNRRRASSVTEQLPRPTKGTNAKSARRTSIARAPMTSVPPPWVFAPRAIVRPLANR